MNLRDRKIASKFGSKMMLNRFREKFKIRTNGCHEWQATRHSNGYGQMRIETVAEYAHRIAWRLAYGEIPEGMYVLHRCDNRRCVNPEHLYLGNQSINIADAKRKGRMVGGKNRRKVAKQKIPWKPVPEWRRSW